MIKEETNKMSEAINTNFLNLNLPTTVNKVRNIINTITTNTTEF
jgi:hypothetical protein